ncbi:MAG TPA: trypsin-like peptidase domain-containing protein [Verrucomicrobiae bacterium]|nr:trypsin-like peptidase domain-containing protein [Verrucomicrobiae bacterium]
MYHYDENRPRKARGALIGLLYTVVGSLLGGLIILALVTNGTIKINVPVVPAATSAPAATTSTPSTPTPIVNSGTTPVVSIADRLGPAVVGVVNKVDASGSQMFGASGGGTGSGVIFDAKGYIVTNNHVVAGANQLEVVLADGRRVAAKLVGTDARTDLAVIKIEADKLTVANFGDSDKLRVGELAVAIGNPLGEDYYGSVTAGIISATQRTIQVDSTQYIDLLQTDAAINPGNSGGALINGQGEVIGINSVKIGGTKVEGMGFAIPSNTVQRVIKDLVEKGKVSRPWLGVIYVSDVNKMTNAPKDLQYGVKVQVAADGPAKKAGMLDGDIIMEVNGEKIDSFAILQRVIFRSKIGDKLDVTVFRNDKQEKISVVLEEMTAK